MSEITIVNTNDLRTIVSDIVEQKLIAFSKWFEAKLIQTEKPLTAKEAMDYLSMSKSTFYRYVKDGKIPQCGLEERVYYRKSEIDNAIKRIN